MKIKIPIILILLGLILCLFPRKKSGEAEAIDYKRIYSLSGRAYLKEKTGSKVVAFLDALYRSDAEYLIREIDLVLPQPQGEWAFGQMTEGFHTHASIGRLSSGAPACLIQINVLYDKSKKLKSVAAPWIKPNENRCSLSILFVKHGEDWVIEGLF